MGVPIADISEDDTVKLTIFIFPGTVDSDEIYIDDIVMLLPPPAEE